MLRSQIFLHLTINQSHSTSCSPTLVPNHLHHLAPESLMQILLPVLKLPSAPPVAVQPQPSVNDLVNHFNSNSLRILDNIAPFKTKHKKPSTLNWLNDHTHEMKRQCRKAERKWKKDRLATSHNILKEAMTAYLSVCCQRGEKCLFFKHYKYKC